MLTSMFSGKSPKSSQETVEYYKNKYIEELESRVQVNEKLAQKDELISKLLTRIKELEGGEGDQGEILVLSKSSVKTSHSPAQKKVSPFKERHFSPERVKQTSREAVSVKEVLSDYEQTLSEAEAEEVVSEVEEVIPKRVSPKKNLVEKTLASDKEEEEEAYEELDGDTLISWTDVIKESHPGSLGQMAMLAKQRLQAAFTEFLLENIPEEKVKKCKVLNEKNKIVVALPEKLQETFGEWLDEKIEQGMLDRGPLAKWKEEQARIFGKVNLKFLILDCLSKKKRIW